MATTRLEPWIGQEPLNPYEGYRRHRVTCGRKQQYVTQAEAQTALDRWKGPVPPTLEVYECSTCGGWHHGNGPIPEEPGAVPPERKHPCSNTPTSETL
jgi:hypothetical protein